MQTTVLILGARGRFGMAAARAFADAGWRVLGQTHPRQRARLKALSALRWGHSWRAQGCAVWSSAPGTSLAVARAPG